MVGDAQAALSELVNRALEESRRQSEVPAAASEPDAMDFPCARQCPVIRFGEQVARTEQ
jgi:hypothetical protein